MQQPQPHHHQHQSRRPTYTSMPRGRSDGDGGWYPQKPPPPQQQQQQPPVLPDQQPPPAQVSESTGGGTPILPYQQQPPQLMRQSTGGPYGYRAGGFGGSSRPMTPATASVGGGFPSHSSAGPIYPYQLVASYPPPPPGTNTLLGWTHQPHPQQRAAAAQTIMHQQQPQQQPCSSYTPMMPMPLSVDGVHVRSSGVELKDESGASILPLEPVPTLLSSRPLASDAIHFMEELWEKFTLNKSHEFEENVRHFRDASRIGHLKQTSDALIDEIEVKETEADEAIRHANHVIEACQTWENGRALEWKGKHEELEKKVLEMDEFTTEMLNWKEQNAQRFESAAKEINEFNTAIELGMKDVGTLAESISTKYAKCVELKRGLIKTKKSIKHLKEREAAFQHHACVISATLPEKKAKIAALHNEINQLTHNEARDSQLVEMEIAKRSQDVRALMKEPSFKDFNPSDLPGFFERVDGWIHEREAKLKEFEEELDRLDDTSVTLDQNLHKKQNQLQQFNIKLSKLEGIKESIPAKPEVDPSSDYAHKRRLEPEAVDFLKEMLQSLRAMKVGLNQARIDTNKRVKQAVKLTKDEIKEKAEPHIAREEELKIEAAVVESKLRKQQAKITTRMKKIAPGSNCVTPKDLRQHIEMVKGQIESYQQEANQLRGQWNKAKGWLEKITGREVTQDEQQIKERVKEFKQKARDYHIPIPERPAPAPTARPTEQPSSPALGQRSRGGHTSETSVGGGSGGGGRGGPVSIASLSQRSRGSSPTTLSLSQRSNPSTKSRQLAPVMNVADDEEEKKVEVQVHHPSSSHPMIMPSPQVLTGRFSSSGPTYGRGRGKAVASAHQPTHRRSTIDFPSSQPTTQRTSSTQH